MQVDIKQIPALRVASVRHIGPYEQIQPAFQRLSELAGPAGLFERPETQLIAIYHDDPQTTPAAMLQSDAGLVVAEGVQLPAGLDERHLRAGPHACTIHIGSYTKLGDVWSRFLHEWLPSSGRRAAASAPYEVYLNNPHDTAEADLRTELRIPLAP